MLTSLKSLILIGLAFGLGFPLASQGQTDPLEEERLSQSGVAISIIFDDSGSMATSNRMQQAKAAFTQWLGGIPEETKLGLVALNKGVMVPIGRNNRDAIKRAVATIEPGGGTPLTKTIKNVGKLIQTRRQDVTPYERHIVIIFTDGEDSNGPSEKVVEALKRLGSATIESVGIGFHGKGDYMKNGATQYYNAGDSAELVQALKQVASELDQQSNIVISPEIQAEMSKQPEVAKTPEVTKTANPTYPQPSPAPPAPAKRRGMPFTLIVIIAFVILAIVRKAIR
jgi:Mg-chelatase subunit ChlD